jgi:ligand-binding SRPBCC domain-containing protein
MIRIELLTSIEAPLERCFDLSRSIDLPMASTDWTGERAIDGVTSGLIGATQEVTWRGRHFGLAIHHTSRITAFEFPTHFRDCMLQGWFRSFCHDHYFETRQSQTAMRHVMQFEAPFGLWGTVVEKLVLMRHMHDLLERRNACIKRVAEGDESGKYLRR